MDEELTFYRDMKMAQSMDQIEENAREEEEEVVVRVKAVESRR
jgi:hypothetical protein